MPSPLSRTNLAGPSGPFKTNPHPFNRLQPLELSCLSFCNSHPLFSIACSLFSQNTGGGVPPGQPSTLPTLRLSDVQTGRRYFVRPLFSYSYKLLFPQPLYFDNHLNCPRVWGVLLAYPPHSSVATFAAIITPLNRVGRIHEGDLRWSDRGLYSGNYIGAYRRSCVRRAESVQFDGAAERDAGSDRAGYFELRLCSARRDDSDARRRQVAHGDPSAERCEGHGDFADAHAV